MSVVCPHCGSEDYEVYHLPDWRWRGVVKELPEDHEWWKCRFCGYSLVEGSL